MKSRLISTLISYFWITLGCAIYALGFDWCFVPNDIAYGGVTGVAQMLHVALTMVGIGTLILVLNVPLFLAGWKWLGGKTLVSSLYAMGISSVLIDLIQELHPFDAMDPLLASLYGGALLGLALGLIFREGSTTGGTDIAARLMKRKLAWLPMGQVLMILDLVVICAAALVFGTVHSALYGLVALAVSTLVMDKVLYGLDNTKVAYIISPKEAEIRRVILQEMDRGATILKGEGAYTGQEVPVILCAFKQRQIVTLKRAVKEIDPNAFMIVCPAHEALGDGFHDYSDEL